MHLVRDRPRPRPVEGQYERIAPGVLVHIVDHFLHQNSMIVDPFLIVGARRCPVA